MIAHASHDSTLTLIALSCFTAYILYSFSDGFGLKPARKVIWAAYSFCFCILSLWATGMFDLQLIISLSSLMAFAMALFQRIENRKNAR